MSLARTGEAEATRAPAGRRPGRGAAAVFWVGLALVALWALAGFDAVSRGELTNDIGIQYHLSGETARGAVPIRDFEHGWNAAGWYVGAVLYRLVGGNETLWVLLWERVTGVFLGGAAVLFAGRRVGLPAGWLAGLVVAWLWLTTIPHGKYAIPSLWLVAFLPGVWAWTRTVPPSAVGAGAGVAGPASPAPPRAGRASHGVALAARFAGAAVLFAFHVDLAVMLTAGLALYDLAGEPQRPWGERLARAAAGPLGLVAALVAEMAVYAALGVAPAELFTFLIFERRLTGSRNFGYQLLLPEAFLPLVYPVTLLAAFAPAVWRRLRHPTRLAAFLHLTLGLAAIRKPDLAHVRAAATLLAPLVVLAAYDLAHATPPRWGAGCGWARRLGGFAAGGAWLAAGLYAGFQWDSLFAIVGVVAAAVTGVAAARRGDGVWMTAGAVAAAAVLLVAATVFRTWDAARPPHDDRPEVIAAAVGADVDACLGPDRRAWVVPGPLQLYETLDVDNPTPFYLFWEGFAREAPRVEAMVAAGEIPVIVAVGDLPTSFAPLRDVLAEGYERCFAGRVAETGDRVTVWRDPRTAVARRVGRAGTPGRG